MTINPQPRVQVQCDEPAGIESLRKVMHALRRRRDEAVADLALLLLERGGRGEGLERDGLGLDLVRAVGIVDADLANRVDVDAAADRRIARRGVGDAADRARDRRAGVALVGLATEQRVDEGKLVDLTASERDRR